ncbi:MAG: sensor histidine kinase [Planctomycetota bacterium]
MTVALSIALIVAWTLVIVRNYSMIPGEFTRNTWLLVLGIISLVIIMTVLVLFSVFLVREIREVNRQYSFIDSVTHELKSPLASLTLCLETLGRSDLAPLQQRELRGLMIDDVERLTSFIDDILVVSRLSHRVAGHNLGEVRLIDLAKVCAASVARQYHLPAAAIVTQIPAELVLVTDRVALETVLKNLIDNAVKYSADATRFPVQILARVDDAAGFVFIEVVDQGIGIAARHLKHVFERFYRVPSEAVMARHGTGLGLFVAASLVRMLGGRLTAHSAGLKLGTTMRIRLRSNVLRPFDPAASGRADRVLAIS